jgi:hypothetical protein
MTSRTPALCAVLLAAPAAHAQLVEDWRALLDPAPGSSDLPQALAEAPTGELYLAGHTRVLGGAFLDALLVKLDAAGGLVWQRVFTADAGSDSGVALALDPNDGSVVLAIHRVMDHVTNDVWVVKYDAQGTQQWAVPYDGPANDRDHVGGQRIAIDAAGNVYVPLTSRGVGTDVALLSLGSDGAFRWERRIDGALHLQDTAFDLAFDGARVVVAGQVDAGTGNAGKLLLAAWALDGTPLWSQALAGPGLATSGDRVVLDPAGNAYVAGRVLDWALVTDVRWWSFDPAGGLRWTHGFGSSGILGAGFLRLDGLGGLVWAGTEQAATNDVLVVRHDLAGNLLWWSTFDEDGQEESVTGLAVDAEGASTVVVANPTEDHFELLAYARQGARTDVAKLPTGFPTWLTAATRLAGGGTLVAGSVTRGGVPFDELLVVRARPASIAFCAGDGAEGACPCGHASPNAAPAGCANSLGSGAELAARGVASLASDTLEPTASRMPASAPCVLLQGDLRQPAAPFGDGLRCITGALRRLYTTTASAGAASFPGPGEPTLSARAAATGDVLMPGTTRVYQVHYRNAAAFCPPETFNVTNALAVEWRP